LIITAEASTRSAALSAVRRFSVKMLAWNATGSELAAVIASSSRVNG
jgi:hypothetical protein